MMSSAHSFARVLLSRLPLRSMWLLVLKKNVTPQQFICKEDPYVGDRAILTNGEAYNFGFRGGEQISYSPAYPYNDKGARQTAWWKNTTDSSLPIIADAEPVERNRYSQAATSPQRCRPYPKVFNTGNHGGDGQKRNTHADGHTLLNAIPALAKTTTTSTP